MAEIPRIARERLRALSGGAPGEHPDADLLTAFAERALTKGERIRVLEHLARCADCREAVSLALPEGAATEEAPVRHWLSSPALHWGVVFASVVVVGAALLQVQRPPVSTELELARSDRGVAPSMEVGGGGLGAGDQASEEEVSAVTTPRKTEASKDAVADADSRRQAAQKQDLPREKGELLANQGLAAVGGSQSVPPGVAGGIGTGSGAGIAGGRLGGFSDSPARRDEAAARARRSGDKDAILVTEEARAPAAPAAAPSTKNEAEGLALSQREADNKVTASEAATFERPAELPMKKHPASTAADTLAVNGARASSVESKLEKSKAAAARWSVTSEGRVQRSLDGGSTWQDVAIAPDARFRAVAAVGANVWAGGSGGALYHSADGGESWQAQFLAAGKAGRLAYKMDDRAKAEENAKAAFDIVRIDFRDAKNGSLTTSDQQTWVTSDAGSTWKKP